jgi:membrane fusion protein (multidrug efflux system)
MPNRDAKLAPLVSGRVARVAVSEGDHVTAGQVLAELDNSSLIEQVKQAEAGVAQAKANLENARLSASRNENLLQRGIASRKEVEDAKTQLAVNEALQKQAEASLSSARAQLSRGVIRAPFDGTVVHRFLGVGDQVDGTAAQPVLEVANLDTLDLLGTVPALRLAEIKSNVRFTFSDPAIPDAIPAKVDAVLPAVDPGTNNGMVRIRLENRKHLLKLGMFASVRLPLSGDNSNRLVVPQEAIYPDESGEPHVYKVVGDEAVSVAVELGVKTKDKVEILSGVKEGDTIIFTGGYGLPEKSKVRVKQS